MVFSAVAHVVNIFIAARKTTILIQRHPATILKYANHAANFLLESLQTRAPKQETQTLVQRRWILQLESGDFEQKVCGSPATQYVPQTPWNNKHVEHHFKQGEELDTLMVENLIR